MAWLCLVGGIFSADLLLPLGYAVPMLYVLPLLLTWFLPARGVSYWAAGGLIGLTILGALCSSEPLFTAALFNRAVASILLFSIAAGLAQSQRLAAAVQQSAQAIARIDRLKAFSAWSPTLSGDPDHIFDEATRVLGRMFDVRVVCLSEIVGGELFFKSLNVNGQVTRNAGRCPLHISPCATVNTAKDLCVLDRVMERFPDATFLRDHRAMAYCGVPLLDSRGEVVAVTCLLDDKPRDFNEEEQELLRIFAQRIAIEIERVRHEAEAMKAEAALRASQERFELAVRGTKDGIWDWDIPTNGNYWSDRWYELVGYERGELTPCYETWASLLHPDDRARVLDRARRHIDERVPYDLEYRMRTKSGIYRWFHACGQAVWDVSGKPLRMAGSISDITFRKQAEAALRESEERLRLVIQGANDGIWDWNLHTRQNVTSARWKEILGYGEGELPDTNASFFDLLHPGDQAMVQEQLRRHLEERVPYAVEIRMKHKDGRYRWCLTRGEAVRDTQGIPVRMVGSLTDINERKRDEAALQEHLCLSSLSAQLHAVLIHEESLEAMLEQSTVILARHLDMALARIWLIGPGDRCDRCHKAVHCAGRERCLHLEASAGLSRNLGGEYCRIPLGALKIGRIASGEGPMWTNDAVNDDRLPNKQWMKDNGLCAFAGFPLMVNGQVMGVLAVFARAPLSDLTLRALELAAQTVSLGVVRKQAEERLRRSEAFISSVLHHLPSVVFVKEARELRHVRFNRACEELLGIPEQEILGKNNFDLFPTEVAGEFTAKDREVLASGRLLDIPEERIETPHGVRYLHTKKIPMCGAGGEPQYLVAISEDITERKRMEEALRESHAELERRVAERTMDLADSNHRLRVEIDERQRIEAQLRESERSLKQAQTIAHLGSWELELETSRLTWSDETYRLFGLDPGDDVASYDAFLACVHPDDRAAVDAAYAGSIRNGRDSYEIEHRIVVQGTGEIRVVHEKCVHIRNDGGTVVRSLGMVHDITERKQMEAMRQAHAVMDRVMQERELLMRNLHDGVLQSLYALRLGLERSRRLLAAQPGNAQESLDVPIDDLALMIAEVRRFMVGQDPVWAQAGTFRDGLTMLVDSYRGAASVEWQLELPCRDEEMAGLSPDESRHLLYIVREAVSNVVRHASATRCRIALAASGDRWQVTIEDDGLGFNPAASRRQGLGVGNMEARARQIGAAIAMTAAPGTGTRIVINMIRRATHVSI